MTYQSPIQLPGRSVDGLSAKLTSRSLAIQVARKMVLWACVNTLILTAIGYVFISERAEQRTLAYLSSYLTERLRAESQVFQAGEANMVKFRDRFLALYTDPKVLPNPDFGAFFEPKSDGSTRLRKKYFTGTVDADGVSRKWTSGYMHGRGPFTKERQRRMILAYRLVSEMGPAWNGAFVNLYAGSPENGGTIYWPGVPWGLLAPADRQDTKAVAPTWSPLYFDAVAKKWNVSYYSPIYFHGRPILYPGEDILLDDLMSRLIRDHPPGAYNLIVGKSGDLIAHPARINDLKTSVRGPKISRLGDPALQSIYDSIAEDARKSGYRGGVRIVENKFVDAYICYGEISGPGWWFVTVYPRALVLESAHEAANGMLLLGLISFTIMTLIVLWVLRDRVGRPISQMRVASERVSIGDYQGIADGSVRLPEDEDNEIGLLAHSFKGMAKKVGDNHRHLEETVFQRTKELQLVNRELEDLSFKDGLTSAYNRRSFDRDLAEMIESGSPDKAMALLLCDIDYFKLYNDTCGHLAGDQVLRLVAETIARTAPSDRVYRYGGEEIALLISSRELRTCRSIAAEVVEAVARLAIPHGESPYGIVTVSAGLVPIDSTELDSDQVIAAADELLYCAKRLGRNRLIDKEFEPRGSKKRSRNA